jgi:hypothetical protein
MAARYLPLFVAVDEGLFAGLVDGSTVRAMILRPERITAGDKVVDIADFGGFRAYQAHLAANSRARDLLGL